METNEKKGKKKERKGKAKENQRNGKLYKKERKRKGKQKGKKVKNGKLLLYKSLGLAVLDFFKSCLR